jgi:hypothetical protein
MSLINRSNKFLFFLILLIWMRAWVGGSSWEMCSYCVEVGVKLALSLILHLQWLVLHGFNMQDPSNTHCPYSCKESESPTTLWTTCSPWDPLFSSNSNHKILQPFHWLIWTIYRHGNMIRIKMPSMVLDSNLECISFFLTKHLQLTQKYLMLEVFLQEDYMAMFRTCGWRVGLMHEMWLRQLHPKSYLLPWIHYNIILDISMSKFRVLPFHHYILFTGVRSIKLVFYPLILNKLLHGKVLELWAIVGLY